MPDSRSIDRAVHYAVKTARPQPVSSNSFSHVNPHTQHYHPHSHGHSRSVASSHSFLPPKSTTPLGSPIIPYSVGQPHPPKLSPGAIPDVRSPSPNYFGLIVESGQDHNESSSVPGANWSPPSSSVKSFAAALPKQLPLDANPEFEAFRREADKNRGLSFNLNGTMLGNQMTLPSTPGSLRLRPPPARSCLQNMSIPGPVLNPAGNQMDIDTDKGHNSAYVSTSSNGTSEREPTIKAGFSMSLSLPRYDSPAKVESLLVKAQRSTLANYEGRQARLSVDQSCNGSQLGSSTQRVDSLPTKLESGPTMISPSQLKSMLDSTRRQDLLLLDLRVAPQYVSSRIQGALNLCIPTTLLKRATFDLKKLQQTFQNQQDQEKFSKWRCTKYLVVYDASSSERRDAQSAINTLKKFTNEGYSGATYILRGGFNAFATSCPDFVDHSSVVEMTESCLSLNDRPGPGPKFAPVVGGVMIPTATNTVNPFFSNIRQNIDLADGVGQIDVSVPSSLDTKVLPRWLRNASEQADHGKRVSEKFLRIELTEQSRMKNAYSMFSSASKTNCVQLSGIEKGGKNRYKDILPFEHARVRLQGKPKGACDYVNASHINSSRSNKRYIAAQGPLPATFEDFWSVIWDQDIRVIVMLTAESEGGQLKCHQYWRDKEFGTIKLRLISEKKVSLDIDKRRHNSAAPVPQSSSIPETGRRRANTTTTLEGATSTPQPIHTQPDAPYVILRKFSLSNSCHPFAPIREITQLHYPSWPDFGAPAKPSHLLALVELANVMQRAAAPVNSSAIMSSSRRNSQDPILSIPGVNEPEPDFHSRPMLVHCSAGCGRTGVFCTIDSVIDMLKRQRISQLRDPGEDSGNMSMDSDKMVSPMTTSTPHHLPSLSSPQPSSKKAQQMQEENGKNIDLSWLRDDGIDLIEKTVEDFRGQRLSMVQTLRQYVLCYETVIEWVWRAQDRSLGGAGSSDGMARSRTRSGSMNTSAYLGRKVG